METIDLEKSKDAALLIGDKLIFLEDALLHAKDGGWGGARVVAHYLGEITEVYQNDVLGVVLRQAMAQKTEERPMADTLAVELAPTQREALDRMVDLTGKSAGSLVQLMFDWGFESWDSLSRLIKPE